MGTTKAAVWRGHRGLPTFGRRCLAAPTAPGCSALARACNAHLQHLTNSSAPAAAKETPPAGSRLSSSLLSPLLLLHPISCQNRGEGVSRKPTPLSKPNFQGPTPGRGLTRPGSTRGAPARRRSRAPESRRPAAASERNRPLPHTPGATASDPPKPSSLTALPRERLPSMATAPGTAKAQMAAPWTGVSHLLKWTRR